MPTALQDDGITLDDSPSVVAAASPASTEEKLLSSNATSNDDAVDDKSIGIEEDAMLIEPREGCHDKLAESTTKIDAPNKSCSRGTYYAVRVGYALPPPLSEEDDETDVDDDDCDSQPNKKRNHETFSNDNNTQQHSAPVKIRSAIFLYWEDAEQFVDNIQCSGDHKAEYAAFNSFEKAEEYLIEEEKENAKQAAAFSEMEIFGHRAEAEVKRVRVETVGAEADRLLMPCVVEKAIQVKTLPPQNPLGGFGTNAPMGMGMMNPFGGGPFAGYYGSGGRVGIGPLTAISLHNLTQVIQQTNGIAVPVPVPVSVQNPVLIRQPTNENRKQSEPHVEKSKSKKESTAPRKHKKQDWPTRRENIWDKMYQQLVDYKKLNDGSIEIPEIREEEKDDIEMKRREKLRLWCNIQIQHQRRWSRGHTDAGHLNVFKIEKLKELGFQFAPSYDQMYERLAAHKAETGTLDVDNDEDEELFAWTKEQKKMLAKHSQNKPVALSDDQVQNLISLGFTSCGKATVVVDSAVAGGKATLVAGKSAAEVKWDSMFKAVVEYKEETGGLNFQRSFKYLNEQEKQLKNWYMTQRKEYKKLQQGQESKLSAQRLQRLHSIGLDLTPRAESIPWEERIRSLKEFAEEHGHLKPPKDHPLASFVSNIRHFYREREEGKKSCLTDERVRDLEEIGFVFKAGKTPNYTALVRKTWEERFQDLLAYKEEHGHTLVPQLSGSLGVWVKEQRTGYRRMKAGKQTFMTAEKALMLKEIGFHFDAIRFKGRNRQVE